MWLDSLPATGLTAVGLIVVLFLGQTRGWWYVKPQIDQMVADFQARLEEVRLDRDARIAEVREDRDARIAEIISDRAIRIAELVEERDHLREALAVTQVVLKEQTSQMEDLVDANRTSASALDSIAKAGERNVTARSERV